MMCRETVVQKVIVVETDGIFNETSLRAFKALNGNEQANITPPPITYTGKYREVPGSTGKYREVQGSRVQGHTGILPGCTGTYRDLQVPTGTTGTTGNYRDLQGHTVSYRQVLAGTVTYRGYSHLPVITGVYRRIQASTGNHR